MPKEETKNRVDGLSLESLLILTVSSTVQAFAEEIAKANGQNPLTIEAHFYRLLEANCKVKAELAEAFDPESKNAASKDRSANKPSSLQSKTSKPFGPRHKT